MTHPVDIHVGKRLRMQRTMAGLSQEDLAKASGITFQQIQKYERGTNRMSASRLYEFSRILKVNIAFFFEELEAENFDVKDEPDLPALREQIAPVFEGEEFSKRETLEMVRNYYRLTAPMRKRLSDLIRAIVDDRAVD